MTLSLATYLRSGAPGGAMLREDGTLVAPTGPEALGHPMELVEDWPQAEGVLRAMDTGTRPPVDYDILLPAPLAAKGDLRGVSLPPAYAGDGGRDPGRGLAAVLLPQGPQLGDRGPQTRSWSAPRTAPGTTGKPNLR